MAPPPDQALLHGGVVLLRVVAASGGKMRWQQVVAHRLQQLRPQPQPQPQRQRSVGGREEAPRPPLIAGRTTA